MAIGARSQTAKTYLENKYESFKDCSLDELIKHAIKALSLSLSGDFEIDAKSATISVVGKNCDFHLIEGAELQRHLDGADVEASSGSSSAAGGGGGGDASEMPLENPDL
jgi:20S proteasome subunit alpha 6